METTKPRKIDMWAASALFLALALNICFDFLLKREFFAQPRSNTSFIMPVIVWPFMAMMYYYIWKGSKQAKTSFLIIYGLVVFKTITGGWIAKSCLTQLDAAYFISQHVLQAGASILLVISLIQARNAELASKNSSVVAGPGDSEG